LEKGVVLRQRGILLVGIYVNFDDLSFGLFRFKAWDLWFRGWDEMSQLLGAGAE
jgi:hypothetical protein